MYDSWYSEHVQRLDDQRSCVWRTHAFVVEPDARRVNAVVLSENQVAGWLQNLPTSDRSFRILCVGPKFRLKGQLSMNE